MALLRSKSTDFFPHKSMTSSVRHLQEGLYTHLDALEKKDFIESLSTYGTQKDIFELVNSLRKILNTPVKRQLFPLVKRVIRQGDVEAFDLLTSEEKQPSTLPRPQLYRPHMADINVLNKYKTARADGQRQTDYTAGVQSPVVSLHRAGHGPGHEEKHKTMTSRRSSQSRSQFGGDSMEIDLGEPDAKDGGFGFTIRGGVDIGVGVYVSSVDNGSLAQKRGLTVGDLIESANDISFNDVTHDEAARIIKAASRLHLTVSRVGRIPGTMTVLETYTWTDPKGRPVSPPPPGSGTAAGEDDGRRKSGTLMLKGSDERKVNIVVQKGQGLGLMVRGGSEYGLGIFISGIDPFSVAENAGLKLGDQILDVNGQSFLDISHSDAVKHLKKRRHLIVTVRDVGKIPFGKTTIDETGWIESTKVDSFARSSSSKRSVTGSITDTDVQKKVFQRGVGTQLMRSSPGTSQQKKVVHENSRHLLNASEQASLNYYLAEYEKGTISIQGLVQALLELLNTGAKYTLLSEIRTLLNSTDLNIFDELLVRRHKEKSLEDADKLLAPDSHSIGSFDSDDVIRSDAQRRTLFSQQKPAAIKHTLMETIPTHQGQPTDPASYNLRNETRRQLSRSTPDLTHLQREPLPHTHAGSRSPEVDLWRKYFNASPGSKMNATDRHISNGKIDVPSDDSGVDINGQCINGHTKIAPGRVSKFQPVVPRFAQVENMRSAPKEREPTQAKGELLARLHDKGEGRRQKLDTKMEHSQDTLTMNGQTAHAKGGQHRMSRPLSWFSKKDVHKSHHSVEHEVLVHRPDDLQPLGDERSSAQGDHPRNNNKGQRLLHSEERLVSNSESKSPADQRHKSTKLRVHHDLNFDPPSRQGTSPSPNQRDTVPYNEPRDNSSVVERPHASSRSSWSPHPSQIRNALTINGVPVPPPQHHSTIIQETSATASYAPWQVQGHYENLSGDERHPGRSKAKNTKLSRWPGVSKSRSSSEKPLEQSLSGQPKENGAATPVNGNEHSPPSQVHFYQKQRRFSSPNKTAPKQSSTVSKYSASAKHSSTISVPSKHSSTISVPSKHSSTISVPSISIQPDTTFHQSDNTPVRQNVTSLYIQSSPSQDTQSGQSHPSAHQNNIPSSSSQTSSQRTLMTQSPGNDSRTVSQKPGNNIVTIAVGGAPARNGQSLSIEALKKNATEKYGEIPLDIVYIYRSKPTLGVAIEGGANTRQPLPKVITVQPGGSAYESGGLRVGHVILEVNGRPAVGLSHMDVARLIAEAFKSKDSDRMELLVTEWSDTLLDTIKVDIGLLKV